MMRPSCEPLESRKLLASTATGAEFRINAFITADQFAPAVASDSNGNFVVVWVSADQDGSGNGIVARRYGASGAPLGAEFPVNQITTGNQSQPTVAMDNAGDFVVAWTNEGDIVARRFDSTGAALDATEFAVNTFTTGNQESPHVAMDATGDIVVAWDSNGQDGSSFGVYARRYNAAGAAQDFSEFLVNQTTLNLQADPRVAMDSAGNFAIAWESGSIATAPDGNAYDIYARRYNAAGVAQGNEFLVNTYTTDYQVFPDIAMDSNGQFVIAWNSYGQDGDKYGVYARRYNSAGNAIDGTEFQVNSSTTDNQRAVMVDSDGQGNFIFTWSSDARDGSGQAIFQRSLNFGGGLGAEFSVNTFTPGNQARPAIALSINGDGVIVWQSQYQDLSGYGIYAQRFAPPNAALPTVSSATFNYLTGHSLAISFSETVLLNLSPAQITIQNLTTSTTLASGMMNLWYSGGTNPAVITFPGVSNGILPDGNYRVTLNGSAILDTTGVALDGDNNATPGGNFVFDFFVFAGDANHDRVINSVDLGILARNWQGFPRTFAQGDFNYDFRVDIKDLTILSTKFGQTLPAPPPPALPASVSIAPTRKTATARLISVVG